MWLDPSAQALRIYPVGFSDGCGRGRPRLELSVGRGPPRLILILILILTKTHICVMMCSALPQYVMYTRLAAAAV